MPPAEGWGCRTPVTSTIVYSIHSLRCEHGVISARGIDLGQGNPHKWRREPMGMTQEMARAAVGGTTPLLCRKPMGSPRSWRTLPERIPQHRPGGTELSRSIARAQVPAGRAARAEPGPAHLPQVCSCSPAPAARPGSACAWSSPGTSRRAAESQEGGREGGGPATGSRS